MNILSGILRACGREYEELYHRLNEMETRIMSALDDLKAQVEATKTVEASAVVLIKGLSDQLAAAVAANDTAAITALSADLKTNTDALAAAIPANTAPPAVAG